MRRQELFARLEAGGMPPEELFALLEAELAASFLPFGRREEQGTRREEVFAGREASSGWEEAGGMRLAGLDARRLAPALFDN
jgi:hypothetical protein